MNRTSHITADHLLKHLIRRGWFSGQHHQKIRPWKVGVCVSGGPDSMALAYLLRHMPHPYDKGLSAFFPCAFVIDHGARSGSHKEALWVQRQLEALDIETFVQRIEWSSDVDPGSLNGFEMKARDRRYRALTNLANSTKVRDLFVGHHEDDQVETVMLRLLRDSRLNPLSFRGMSRISTVPTSEGYPDSCTYSTQREVSHPSTGQGTLTAILPAETYNAGMRLHRPLLDFPKSQLIATCEHFDVPFVQDKTNFNSQLTPRNAIRHVRSHRTLPKSLHGEALLKLCQNADKIYHNLEEQARWFFHYVVNFHLHSGSGVLLLRLRSLPSEMTEPQLRGYSFFMQRVVSLVSPLKDDLLPSISDRPFTKSMYALCTTNAGLRSTAPTSLLHNLVVCKRAVDDLNSDTITLRFSRQPIASNQIASLAQNLYPDEESNKAGDLTNCHSQWILWDGRFWMQFRGDKTTMNQAIVRPYKPSDVPCIIQTLKQKGLQHSFEKMLSTYAPGAIRFTMPVLIVNDKIIAFPTLNVSIATPSPLSWQVRYARNKREMEFFLPHIRDGDGVFWNFGQGQLDAAKLKEVTDEAALCPTLKILPRR